MAEDYAKLAGLSSEEDVDETVFSSVKKRLPWLILLLVLGLVVSSVVGIFEKVIDLVAVSVCFQSLILDMAGNVGTQSLAVTIRVLNNEDLTVKDKLKLVKKEVKVGFFNGLLMAGFACVFITLYIFIIKNYPINFSIILALCIGLSLIVTMIISSLVGTLIPLTLNSMNIDPAVASGPLITTVNDLVSAICYYSIVYLFVIVIFQLV